VYAEFEVQWLQFSQLSLTTAPRLSQKRDDESIGRNVSTNGKVGIEKIWVSPVVLRRRLPGLTYVRGEEWRTPEHPIAFFPKWQSELFKMILEEENLRSDRDGRPHTAYSPRYAYTSMRLIRGSITSIQSHCYRFDYILIFIYITNIASTRLQFA
jgi:hypothetical protein